MRTGKDLIRATKPFAMDDGRRSWWCLLSTGCLLLAALAGTVANVPLVFRLVCSVVAGLLILRFFVIYHDQQHHAILANSPLADALMTAFGIYSLSPATIWKASHNHHHNHNSKLRGSNIGSFPVMTKAQFLRSTDMERKTYLFMRHPLTILFGYLFVFLYGMCLFPFINRPRAHYDGLIALVLHAVIGVTLTLCFGWQGLLLAQTLPHLVACGIGSYLFYAQHNFPDVSFHDAAGWTY
jgi:omega-6 fatty acid desaturase (delta-12 desaturase)